MLEAVIITLGVALMLINSNSSNADRVSNMTTYELDRWLVENNFREYLNYSREYKLEKIRGIMAKRN